MRRSRRENAKWKASQTRSWHLVRGGSFFQRFARGAGVVRGTFGLLREKGETEEETREKQKKKQATCLLKCWVLSGAKVHESCRSPKVLQNVSAHTSALTYFDTAGNEPANVFYDGSTRYNEKRLESFFTAPGFISLTVASLVTVIISAVRAHCTQGQTMFSVEIQYTSFTWHIRSKRDVHLFFTCETFSPYVIVSIQFSSVIN